VETKLYVNIIRLVYNYNVLLTPTKTHAAISLYADKVVRLAEKVETTRNLGSVRRDAVVPLAHVSPRERLNNRTILLINMK
jgi:hypothetical protein